jgi:hypothetical protein
MAKIYLASSWRNTAQPALVAALREDGHEVYDFRNPPNATGFAWKQVGYDQDFIASGDVTPKDLVTYRRALKHPRAVEGFKSDFDAMKWADTFVLLLPCGRSAHLEAGWAAGAGKPVHVLLSTDRFEPELMYLLCAEIHQEESILRHVLRYGCKPVGARTGSPGNARALGDEAVGG